MMSRVEGYTLEADSIQVSESLTNFDFRGAGATSRCSFCVPVEMDSHSSPTHSSRSSLDYYLRCHSIPSYK